MLPVLPSSSIGLIKKAGVPCWQDVKLVVGCWLLATGYWLLATGYYNTRERNVSRETFLSRVFDYGYKVWGVPFPCFPTDRFDTVLRVLKVLRFVECGNCCLLLVIWTRCTANSQLQTKMFHVKQANRLKRVLKFLRVLRFAECAATG